MLKIKKNKDNVLVMIIGHKWPDYLLDTAEAFEYHHVRPGVNFRVVFAIDNNEECAEKIASVRNRDCVYNCPEKNGWGRGVLRTIVQGIEHFSKETDFNALLTLDDDTLTVGPFLRNTLRLATADTLFVGAVRPVFYAHEKYHRHLYYSGYLSRRPFNYHNELVVGPCMLWTEKCLKVMSDIGLRPISSFDRIYPEIFFSHDQVSTYLASVGLGRMMDIGQLAFTEWRNALRYEEVADFGRVPVVKPGVGWIHPVRHAEYSEEVVRQYFKHRRTQERRRVLH